ncbi:MAG: SH3 domain-containing protein [Sulfuritalea sp.]|jgi:SH3-like domain-containing protein|nr:SH3 domain-containing protein [Sulfuritalea sp.]
MPALVALRRFPAAALALAALTVAWPAWALDYRTVAEATPMYDAPSAKAKPLFVALAGTPVELVVSLEGWSKVRDSKGDLAWIEKKQLTEKRNVIVRLDRAQVRAAAEDKAPLVFEAERDVVLELLEAVPGGWVKVKHRDGQSGFLKAHQVWGL